MFMTILPTKIVSIYGSRTVKKWFQKAFSSYLAAKCFTIKQAVICSSQTNILYKNICVNVICGSYTIRCKIFHILLKCMDT